MAEQPMTRPLLYGAILLALTALITVTLCRADELRWFQPTIPGTGLAVPGQPGALILKQPAPPGAPHGSQPTWIIPTVPGTSQIAPGGAWGLILDLDDKEDADGDD